MPHKHTEEFKKALAERNRNRVVSESTREKMRQRMTGNKQMLGHKLSQEAKDKISKANTGRDDNMSWFKGRK